MTDSLDADRPTVLVAIDWENIRLGARFQNAQLTPATLCHALNNVASIFGHPDGGKAFGDWSLRTDDAIEFAQNNITAYHAPRTLAGKDRADPSILLEVYDWIREIPTCKTIILASGDSDFQVLIDRAKHHDKRVILCAFSTSVARDMLAAAPLFPLEAELGTTHSQPGAIPVTLHQPSASQPEASDEPTDDGDPEIRHALPAESGDEPPADPTILRFVQNMHQLESRLAFVGYSMLCNEWMLEWAIAVNEQECRRIVEDYINAGIIERHDVPNPNNPTYPTAAVRLIREHEQVRGSLRFDDRPIANPVLPEDIPNPASPGSH